MDTYYFHDNGRCEFSFVLRYLVAIFNWSSRMSIEVVLAFHGYWWLYFVCDAGGGLEHLRTGLFQSASLISSTGFASVDYNLWHDSLKGVLIAIMLIGVVLEVQRWWSKGYSFVSIGSAHSHRIKKSLFPEALFNIKFNERSLPIELLRTTFNWSLSIYSRMYL